MFAFCWPKIGDVAVFFSASTVKKSRTFPTAYFEGCDVSIASMSFKWNIYPKIVLLNFSVEPVKIANYSDWEEFGDYSLKNRKAWILFQIFYFNLKMYTIFELEPIILDLVYICLFQCSVSVLSCSSPNRSDILGRCSSKFMTPCDSY